MIKRIVVDAGNYFATNHNVGDRAIYQTIVQRLRTLWPGCEISWITCDAALLLATCPEVTPLVVADDRLPLPQEHVSSRWAELRDTLGFLQRRRTAVQKQEADARRILRAVQTCDLVLATGGGYFSDSFAGHAWTLLDTLHAGIRLGKPTAILSCGFEPTGDAALTQKMLAVLPNIDLIICREALQSPDVVYSYGVNPARVMIAGDDAVELAYGMRPEALGSSLGLNLRQAAYAGIDSSSVERLRAVVQHTVTSLAAPVVAVPISLSGPSDPDAIRQVLTGLAGEPDAGHHLSSAPDVIRQAGQCRLVITGSYHAAVFALAQGVSVVALTASPHYRAKLSGLRAQFGGHCQIVALEREDTPATLRNAIDHSWEHADSVRPALLAAARQQLAASDAAYQRLYALLAGPHASLAPALAHPPIATAPASTHRAPAMPLTTPSALAEFALTPAEIETFREQGFVGPFTAFAPEEMTHYQQAINDRVLTTPTPYCPFGLRIRHLDSKTVHELCSAPAIVERMASIYGPDLVLWNSNLFNKPPANPSRAEEYPWHQDYYNWKMEPVVNISAWLAITPATLENGCLEVIPGSHRQIIPPVVDTDPALSLRFGGIASDPSYVDESKKVSLPLLPGQFFLFNERLLHHSNPNRTQANRLGLAIRVTVPIAKVSESFPCILLRGQDTMGFNRYAPPPTGEPDAEWLAALPPEHNFAFDRPIPGMGWHLLETDGTQRFAWTGLEPESWIDFRPVAGGDHVLRCEVIHRISAKAVDALRAYVNGQPVELQHQQNDDALILQARVPAAVLQSRTDRVRVLLAGSDLLRPCDLNPASSDKRSLGLGIRRIALTPAEA
jgi:polysaccharide pyruvyl transferase WcaK-like protein